MEPYYINNGMGSMHTVQQPADLNNSLLSQPFNPNTTAQQPYQQTYQQPVQYQQQPYQQPAPKKGNTKRYQCTWEGCDRMFAGPHNVNQHIREAHTKEKPFKCPECTALGYDTGFARPFSLNRHRRQRHHVDTRVARPAGVVENARGPGAMAAGDADMGGMLRGVLFGNNVNNNSAALPQAPANMGGFQNNAPATQNGEDDWFGAFANSGNAAAQADNSGGQAFAPDATIDDFFNSGNDQMNVKQPSDQIQPAVISCGHCGYKTQDQNPMLLHQHDEHLVPNTPLCDCTVCKMIYVGDDSEPGAQAHAQQLAAGALDVSAQEVDTGLGEMGAGFDMSAAGDAMDFAADGMR